MNKTAIKNFAVWARNKLEKDIAEKAGLLGVSENGIVQPLAQSTDDLLFLDIGTKEYSKIGGKTAIGQRKTLIEHIKSQENEIEYERAYHLEIEGIAYTWFNRLIAIRFMEVNDYLPIRCRVLSSENPAKNEPDLVTNPFDTDLDFSDEEIEKIYRLKDDASKEASDELFGMLFIKLCNRLHEILPELFEKTDDYTEPLLSLSFADKDGIVYHLVHDIAEADFNVEKEGQVEIIGWLYQYYISEKHNQVINILGKGAVKKEDIPAATQLFTTDWVVRYMVDNSLGRYWIERHPESNLADKLDFFVTPKNGKITYINEKIEPEELTFFDPCMGSGHILVYAFDVLMEIYREAGYTDRDAAINILEKNLFGLDIDQRAYQLAYFAVMMKARSYNRRLFTKGVKCNVAVINESNGINKFTQANITLDRKQNEIGEYLIDVFRHAKEIGSLQTVAPYDYDTFSDYVDSCEISGQIDLFSAAWSMHTVPMVRKLIAQAKILSRKYKIVCTNPPYMGKMDNHLKNFVIDQYKPYSGDLFSVFIYRNFDFCINNGYSAFMAPFVWMFIKTYENLRDYIIESKSIASLIQMEYSAYEEATVPICTFVLKNGSENNEGLYIRLSDFKGGMDIQKKKVLEALEDKNCGYFYEVSQINFTKIPGVPIAYWLSEKWFETFETMPNVAQIAKPRVGQNTGDNERFLRLWHEVEFAKISFETKHAEIETTTAKWIPYSKGGAFRRWYGNYYYLINWENNGKEIKDYAVIRNKGKHWSRYIQNLDYMCCEGVTWSDISSGKFSCRYLPEGFICDVKGSSAYPNSTVLLSYLSFLNSSIADDGLKVLAPTISFQTGDISRLPFGVQKEDYSFFDEIAQQQINLSKEDWDAYETSWDFQYHPLTKRGDSVAKAFQQWKKECDLRFVQLKENEERINQRLIDIYDLVGETSPSVNNKDVSVRKADEVGDIKSLLSYAVGCMFGRYSLDKPGLIYAGGIWDSTRYKTFIPNKDNCIPITDEKYFEDDIVERFCDWLAKAYGPEKLEENLNYIARVLGNKGLTAREVIRNYFLNNSNFPHQ